MEPMLPTGAMLPICCMPIFGSMFDMSMCAMFCWAMLGWLA